MKEATAIILMQVFLVILIFALVFINILTNKSKKENSKPNKTKHNKDCPKGCDGKKCPHGEKCTKCYPPNPECCCYDFQCNKCKKEKENDGVIREEEEEPAKVPVSKEEHPYQTHSRINDIVLRKNKLIRQINKKVNNLNEEL